MKKTFAIIIILGLFALGVSAQVPSKPFNIYAGGGLTITSSPQIFKDRYKLGYHFSSGLGIKAAPFTQIIGKVEYHSIARDWQDIRTLDNISDNSISGGTRQIWMFGLDARLGVNAPMSPIKPFIIGGIGLAYLSETDIATTLPPSQIPFQPYESQTKVYLNVGGGLDFKAGPILTMFVEGRYLNIQQDGDNLILIPISLGIKF
ncbi:MAG: porin family protein [FCB group bacterium]|nr:porin family protein [FCB group bacterium]